MGLLYGAWIAASVTPAAGHIVVASKTVRELVVGSDLIVRARIVTQHGVAAQSSESVGVARPVVEADVLEVIAGAHEGRRVRFAQHGHGVATFEPGREHLLFLTQIGRSRELDALGEAGTARWVSLQEHDDAHPLTPTTREALLAAVRAYVRVRSASTPADAMVHLREANRRLLTSGDGALAASAIRDLVAAPSAEFVTREDLPALLAVVDDPSAPIGVRIGLLTQLEHRGLVDGRSRWQGWLADDAPTAVLVPALRAAGRDPRPEIRARVVACVASDREPVAAAAADAAGRRGDDAVVTTLAAALQSPSPRVRQAAIRGLGRVATEKAIGVLEQAGTHHADTATRRLAAAEARKRRASAIR